jgi:hypothetical protein
MCILLRIGIMLLSASSSDQSPTIVSLQPGSEAECLTVAVVHVAVVHVADEVMYVKWLIHTSHDSIHIGSSTTDQSIL